MFERQDETTRNPVDGTSASAPLESTGNNWRSIESAEKKKVGACIKLVDHIN